jgi:hypothetical protein
LISMMMTQIPILPQQIHLCLSIEEKPRISKEPLYLFAEALAVRLSAVPLRLLLLSLLLTLPWLHLYRPFDAATSDPDPALTNRTRRRAR